MNRIPAVPLVAFAVLLAAANPCAADDYLDWTSTQGSTIRAQFVDERDGEVTLRKADGKQIVIRLSQLSEASREQVSKLTADPATTTGSDAVAAEGGVKTFADGPWRGRHAVYERETFVAVADRWGNIRVTMKKDGAPIDGAPSCRLWPSLLFYPADSVRFREIASVASDAAPSMQPEKLTFSGETKTGTTFEVTYVFKDDTIAAYGHLRDPGDIETPTLLRIGMRFPKHEAITPRMSREEMRKIVGESTLEAKAEDGSKLEWDYLDAADLNGHEKVKKGLESVTVKPAICGPHTVKFTAPDRKYGTLRIWNASTTEPHMGFGVSIYRDDPTERSSRARILLEIE